MNRTSWDPEGIFVDTMKSASSGVSHGVCGMCRVITSTHDGFVLEGSV